MEMSTAAVVAGDSASPRMTSVLMRFWQTTVMDIATNVQIAGYIGDRAYWSTSDQPASDIEVGTTAAKLIDGSVEH